MLSAAVAVIETSLVEAVAGTGPWGEFAFLAATGAVGLSVSLLGAYEGWLATRGAAGVGPGAASAAEIAGRPATADLAAAETAVPSLAPVADLLPELLAACVSFAPGNLT